MPAKTKRPRVVGKAAQNSPIQQVSRSFVKRYRAESQSTDWGQSLAMYGLFASLEKQYDPVVEAYLRRWLSFHLSERVGVNYFCGSWSIGLVLPMAEKRFPELQLGIRDTAERIYEFITRTALRNGEGILLHNVDLPNIYIDTVFYSSVILSKLGPMLGVQWEDEAILQLVLHLDLLQDGEKPFFIHCQENNGGKRSEGSWARGNGWVMMTLAELLPLIPKSSKRGKDLLTIFRELSAALANLQTKAGLWRTILDDSSAYPEVSATAMYLYALAKARNEGFISHEFDAVIASATKAMLTSVDGRGRVTGVSEGTWPGTIEYYKSLKTGEWWWGTGAFLLAFSELAS